MEETPEDAYPPLKHCRQCGQNQPADLYVICLDCHKKNLAYDAKVANMRIEYSRTREPTTKQSNYMTKGTKQERNPRIAEYDSELHYTEHNTRTEYHGDNYNDE
jgi:hypothetical protein